MCINKDILNLTLSLWYYNKNKIGSTVYIYILNWDNDCNIFLNRKR